MSLVRAQFGEPKRKTAPCVRSFCFACPGFACAMDIMINSHVLYHNLALDDSEVVASKKQLITVFYEAKPPKARSWRKRVYRATRSDYATVERRAHDCEFATCRSDTTSNARYRIRGMHESRGSSPVRGAKTKRPSSVMVFFLSNPKDLHGITRQRLSFFGLIAYRREVSDAQ